MPRKTRSAHSQSLPTKYRQLSLFDQLPSSPPHEAQTSSRKPLKKVKTKPSKRVQINSDSEVETVSPIRPSLLRKSPLANLGEESDSSDVGKIKFERQSSPLPSDTGRNSDSDNLPEAGLSTQTRHSKLRRVVDSDAEKDFSDVEIVSKPVGRRLKRKQGQIHDSDSDLPDKRKKRLVKGTRPSSGEENDDVLDGIDEEKIIGPRLRGQSSKKSRFLENLERLKLKKKGRAISESEQETDEDMGPIPGSRPNWSKNDSSQSEKDDQENEEEIDDFIVEDGDDVPVANPVAFSMNTHQDLVHHFKIVCQYFVHLAVSSEEARLKIADRLIDDEYFSVPLTIARQKLSDIRDSIASSVWRPPYKKALQTYPEFVLTNLDFAIPQCDACHLGGRMSKFVGRLSGTPYDRKTFQALDFEESSDDSDNVDDTDPPEFHLGRFCAQRTKTFHELCHWEYELFRELSHEVDELSDTGRGFVKVAYAGGVAPPDDVSDADQIMDWLDTRGIIGMEWQKVKNLMSRATNLDADLKKGKEDDS
ncbi:hypothetical protein DFH11DRAFT_1575762 [Phellopilus nigrolimitatus]|nr:hypothetical protein DFH11DRAFT_1575762 [Phellopilus nigrolimitatus]